MAKAKITNLSGGNLKIDFDIREMKRIVFFPDYSPSKGKLPVGTVAVFDDKDHIADRNYIGSDVGCGMLLALLKDFDPERLKEVTNKIAGKLLDKREGIGSLGGGNHFITLYEVAESTLKELSEKDNVVLIHSGSREEGSRFYERGLIGDTYLEGQRNILDYAKKNRASLLEKICESAECNSQTILDRTHNSVEYVGEEVVYRKGAVKIMPGEISVMPSSMSGDALLIRANESVKDIEYSLSHATGRKISRSEARKAQFFLKDPKNIYLPYFIYPENLNTEMPQCYRTIDDTFPLIKEYAKIESRLTPRASIML